MRKLYILLSVVIVLTGCKGFLDVNTKGEVFDNDMFASSEKYEDALYGVYSEIAGEEWLYGGYLQWAPEVMCGNVTNVSDYKLGNLAMADWDSQGPGDIRENIWYETYRAISNVNNIITHAQSAKAGSIKNLDFYKGEALAIRALLHFELLRLFGAPYWADDRLKEQAIPYCENYTFKINPFLSYNEVCSKILNDFLAAEKLLADDVTYVEKERNNVSVDFFHTRVIHLNLYAVQALIARLYWTIGDLEKAADYADKVIKSGKFSFRPQSAFVQPDNGTVDMNETILALYSKQFQLRNANKYGLVAGKSNFFELASDRKAIYMQDSGTGTDYRLAAWFDDNDDKLIKLVNKVYFSGAEANYSGRSILGYNIIRLPEMYFIMAEYYIDKDPSKAKTYFDDVIKSRGLESLADSGQELTYERLFRERRKEFYGEGFTWHEMKKKGADIITATGAVLNGKMASTYTLPVPKGELEGRNKLN